MKLLQLIPSFVLGGAQRQLSLIAPELARLGHEVHVAYLHEGPNFDRLRPFAASSEPPAAGEPPPGVVCHRLATRGNYNPLLFLEILSLIRDLRPDLVQTWILQFDILGGIASRRTGVPWMLREPMSALGYTDSLKNRWRIRTARSAHGIISNSRSGDQYWESHGFTRRFIVPNALPAEEIERAAPIRPEEFGIPPDHKIVLYAGRLEDGPKNILNLVEGLIPVVQRAPVTAVLCGDGIHRPQIEALLESRGAADRFLLTGYTPHVWSWMKRADLFVFMSHYEGLPNAVMEAMTCGCPLAVSDISAHREFLDEASAVLVDQRDPGAIAEGVTRALNGPEAARQRAETARRIARQWSVTASAQRFLEVYREVLSEGVLSLKG